MNVVDSSGWLEYFSDGSNASFFEPAIIDTSQLVVPTISLYEVYKRVCQQRTEAAAAKALSFMRLGQVVDLNQPIALLAAKLSIEFKLPMADSIIWASAKQHNAVLWTQDADFRSLAGVHYIEKAYP